LTHGRQGDFINHMVEEMEGSLRRGPGRPPGGPERRDALVAAALAVIAREGFEGLRMRGVAADAGLDHSTVHHYFASKEALITAVVAQATSRFRSTTPAEGTGAERLRSHLGTLASRIVAEPDLHIVLRELDLRAKRDAGLHATIQAHERGWRGSLTAAADQARREGALSPLIAPETAAELIISTVKGASLNAATAWAVCGGLAALLTGADAG
jgi:AcrR family transcriptional regulator